MEVEIGSYSGQILKGGTAYLEKNDIKDIRT